MNKWIFVLALVLLGAFQWFYYSSTKSYKEYKTQQVEEASQGETPGSDDPLKAKDQKS